MSGTKPTNKQLLAFQKSLENGGNMAQAMKAAGYKDATINNPTNLTESDGWVMLMEIFTPDEKLMLKTAEGLEANKQLSTRPIFKKDAPTSQSARELPAANGNTDDFIEVPDYAVRHKYLETALKLKGRLKKDGDINVDGNNIQINVVAGGYVPKSGRTNGSSEGSAV